LALLKRIYLLCLISRNVKHSRRSLTSGVDSSFLAKWRKEYYEHDDLEYSDLIRKDELTVDDLGKLLSWKSSRFRKTIRNKLENNIKEINDLRKEKPQEPRLDDFVREFYPDYPEDAPIFGTFIKHILNPDEFPVYDQFVHKAYHRLSGTQIEGDCLMDCYERYRSFSKRKKQSWVVPTSSLMKLFGHMDAIGDSAR